MMHFSHVVAVLAYAAPIVSAGSPTLAIFQTPLPIAPVATPYTSVNVDGQQIDYYQLTIEPFQKQLFDNLGATNYVGYNGLAPGPAFYVKRGVETVVRFHNNHTEDSVVHLHGSQTRSPWDGWADDSIKPGQLKDYYYPNNASARSLWYHDHADGITSGNCFEGLTATYIIWDPAEEGLGLPTGKYDVPLQITDKMYDSNGQFVAVNDEQYNFFGDVNEVNFQPWPYMDVEPRKYRFRLYNTAMSRPYELHVEQANGDWLDFNVIASDSGLFGSPVSSNNVVLSMGERYEIVIDFAQFAGQNLTMKNTFDANGVPVNGNLDLVMSFVVGSDVEDWSSNDVPSTLNSDIAWPQSSKTEPDQTFRFQVGGETHWTINGIDFNDANNRVLAKPAQGTVELWELQYASGGSDFHPIHIHLVDFQIISRTGGSRGVSPYESAGLKDIVLLEPGETVRVLAYYGVWDGLYMFHCHNLIHEDHTMMAAFNVTALADLGYPDNTQTLSDPMDARFVAQDWSAQVYAEDSIQSTLSYLGGLGAYNAAYQVSTALEAYYSTNPDAAEATATVAPVAANVKTYAAATTTQNSSPNYQPSTSNGGDWWGHGPPAATQTQSWGGDDQNWGHGNGQHWGGNSNQGHTWRA